MGLKDSCHFTNPGVNAWALVERTSTIGGGANSSAAVCGKSAYRVRLHYEDSLSGESCTPRWPLSSRRTSDRQSPDCNELPHNPTSVELPVCVPGLLLSIFPNSHRHNPNCYARRASQVSIVQLA